MIGKTATSLLEQQLLLADGNSDAVGGFDAASTVDVVISARQVVGYTTAEGDRQTHIPGNETLTVTVQHSDDDDTYEDVDAHEFDNDGLATITISSPKAYIRIAWALSGDNPQPVLTATAIATGKTQNQIGAPGGGSQPTDDVISILESETAGATPPSFPIVAVNVGGQTMEIAGDHTAVEGFTFSVIRVTGSTGNDGTYAYASITYNGGTDRTTVTFDDPFSDATVDGNIEALVVYSTDIVVPANSAIEWILLRSTAQWDEKAYAKIGDSDDEAAFVTLQQIWNLSGQTEFHWQWPWVTLTAQDEPTIFAAVSAGSRRSLALYPAGTTVKVRVGAIKGGAAGISAIVVHHHVTEPATATIT